MRTSHASSFILLAVHLVLGMAGVRAGTIYENNFDGGSWSMDGFSQFGGGNVALWDGQLTLSMGGFQYAAAALNLESASPAYPGALRANTNVLTWAVKISNQDAGPKNLFSVVLACNSPDPYDIQSVGYAFAGGGYVGDRMMLWRFDHGLGGGGQILVDVPSTNGLGVLPEKGSFRITYDPSTDNWSVFGQVGLSYSDPTRVTNLWGSAADSRYTTSPMPYFSLAGAAGGTDYFDNLAIYVVPEPAIAGLAVLGGLILLRVNGVNRKTSCEGVCDRSNFVGGTGA